MSSTNIVVLATYWNESQWIRPSLQQLELINPKEIIFCDGCFDPRHPPHSTDGTREHIQTFIRNTPIPCQLISPLRMPSPASRLVSILTGVGCRSSGFRPYAGRFKKALVSQLFLHPYRVNQAITFAFMARLSKFWQNNVWFMTYDADQFYSGDLIKAFLHTNDPSFPFDLIEADEYTFPVDFRSYTDRYEARSWNNLPFRIRANLAFYPTRHIVTERLLWSDLYALKSRRFYGGCYHHYKFRSDPQRMHEGYSVGDRKPPSPDRFAYLKDASNLKFPAVITNNFSADLTLAS